MNVVTPAARCTARAQAARDIVAQLAPPAGIRPGTMRDRIRPEYRIFEIAQSAVVRYATAARYYEDGNAEAGQNLEREADFSYEAATELLADLDK